MSANAVLERRALDCIRSYGVSSVCMSDEELAAELVDAVLPDDEEDWSVGEPMWFATRAALDVCTNCLCTDCGCCVGCGGVNADVDGTYHGMGACV